MHAPDAPRLIAARPASVARHRDLHPQAVWDPRDHHGNPPLATKAQCTPSRPAATHVARRIRLLKPRNPPAIGPSNTRPPRPKDQTRRAVRPPAPSTPRRALPPTPSTPPTRTSTIQHDASRMQEAGSNLTAPPRARCPHNQPEDARQCSQCSTLHHGAHTHDRSCPPREKILYPQRPPHTAASQPTRAAAKSRHLPSGKGPR